jgi:hypothetical protein
VKKSLRTPVTDRTHKKMELDRYFTTLSVAVRQLEHRRRDPNILARVEDYLEGDLPAHFRDGPLLYLARHVATPNQETLAFLAAGRQLQMPTAIGEDLNDVFVSHNPIKHALGTLPIIKGRACNNHDIVEYVTVIDFNEAQGRRLNELRTFAGQSLAKFHNSLFDLVDAERPAIVNDTDWIDRNHRGDLLEHYKRHLALFVAHGILCEYFIPEDPAEYRLLREVVLPAFEFIEEVFGLKPLMAPHVRATVDNHHQWDAYPREVFGLARRHTRHPRWQRLAKTRLTATNDE